MSPQCAVNLRLQVRKDKPVLGKDLPILPSVGRQSVFHCRADCHLKASPDRVADRRISSCCIGTSHQGDPGNKLFYGNLLIRIEYRKVCWICKVPQARYCFAVESGPPLTGQNYREHQLLSDEIHLLDTDPESILQYPG